MKLEPPNPSQNEHNLGGLSDGAGNGTGSGFAGGMRGGASGVGVHYETVAYGFGDSDGFGRRYVDRGARSMLRRLLR